MSNEVTKEDVIGINKSVTERYGDAFGLINEGNLDFLMAKVGHMGDPFKMAAELLYGITRGHPFMDGNKRTAFQSAVLLLERNGYVLEVGSIEGEEFMLDVASSKNINLKKVESWLREKGGRNE